MSTTLSSIFDKAYLELQNDLQGSIGYLTRLRQDVKNGRMSSEDLGLLLVKEVECRLQAESAIFEIFQALARVIDNLYERKTSERERDSGLEVARELRYIIAGWSEKRAVRGT